MTGRLGPLVLMTLAAGCSSGGGVCGDGILDGDEQCDRGGDNGKPGVPCSTTCKLIGVPIPTLQVSWELLRHTGVANYDGAHCADVAAVSAHVIVTGPARIDTHLPCLAYGHVFASDCPEVDGGVSECSRHLPPGAYQATVTLLRADGTAVTNAVSTPKITAIAGPPTNLPVDFEMTDFLMDYQGSLQLRTSWGQDGARCGDAVPPVVDEALRLIPGGKTQPVAGMTQAGTPLDGTPARCYTPGITQPTEDVQNLAWGTYQLTISGYGRAGLEYAGQFEVFVGPGGNNQPWTLTVPANAGIDASVPVDAGAD